jgi:aspartyl-tRNA(Asn)/glutamyl-tRNA(Gln) amidotransferase subunit A
VSCRNSPTIADALASFDEGRLVRRDHISRIIQSARSALPDGYLIFLAERFDAALSEACAWDAAAKARLSIPALAGIGISVKACIDVAGFITTAGSQVLARRDAAPSDAAIVERLRKAGAIVLGHTNMTEFAYSGLGLNPHFGAPLSPFVPSEARVAGGSTSGGAVSVAFGGADAALGTDTSGSVRIPAAFCGLTGFKPSRGRYPAGGIIPLSPSFDVPGVIARSVECCRLLDRVLASQRAHAVPTVRSVALKLLVPTNYVLSGLDDTVRLKFDRALRRIEQAGVDLCREDVPELARVGEAARLGGIVAAESYAWHRELIAQHANSYDPRVASRILAGKEIPAHSYFSGLAELGDLASAIDRTFLGIDALVWPTVAILPPRRADLIDDAAYAAVNSLVIRNTEFANRVDLPSLTIPLPGVDDGPVGLLLTGRRKGDDALLAVGALLQSIVGTGQ